MGNNMKRLNLKKSPRSQRGFTLIETAVATLIMLVGLLAVAQLVATSVFLNTANRDDSTAMVLAQNELNQFVGQQLATFSYTDTLGNVCTLGDSATTGSFVGSPVVTSNDNRQVINFSSATVAGYNFTWADPNDPSGARYDIRWAVYTFANGSGKRFVLGARKLGGNEPFYPVNLDTMVQK
jgi:prepilin-type N-terminal cleavage/methylation domain-containing protein